MPLITREHHGLHLVVEVADDGDVRLRHLAAVPFDAARAGSAHVQRLVEIQAVGCNQRDHHGLRYTGTQPGSLLRHHATRETADGLEIEQRWQGVAVISHLRFAPGLPAVQSWTTVTCLEGEIDLDYVSSFCLTGLAGAVPGGLAPADQRIRVHLPHNIWYGEAQWQEHALGDLGLHDATRHSMARHTYGALGTWSTCGFLPSGALSDRELGTTIAWQVEHNGSWLAEYAYSQEQLGLRLSGPTCNEHQWSRKLTAGEEFTSVRATVAVVRGGLTAGLQALTAWRRAMRRPHRDLRELPVIFNDYMNCLNGDPTTAKLLPLIDAAAAAGCEYFTIDAGWYSDGAWWDGVGEWLPSGARFPGGIAEPLKRIRERGMVPGLWLELEVMGIRCPLAETVPEGWFFHRRGRRVIDHSRYQLDFRHPGVVAHADAVIDRLVRDYGVGYIKMDYNINAGVGTDRATDGSGTISPGDGLLQHNRAYLAWLDRVMDRHPALVIENCGSGGMRLDYALLARHPIQSVTDQTDYRKNALVAAAAASACTPEQAAIWSYPQRDGDRDEVIVNMVNAMLLRIHQSGHLGDLAPERLALVSEGIATYKAIRHLIPSGLPSWPLGMPAFGDGWTAVALAQPDGDTLLAVWRLEGQDDSALLPLPHLAGRAARVELLYPAGAVGDARWQPAAGTLSVRLPVRTTARLYRITPLPSPAAAASA